MSKRNSHSNVFGNKHDSSLPKDKKSLKKCNKRSKKEQEALSAKCRVDAINEILRRRHEKG